MSNQAVFHDCATSCEENILSPFVLPNSICEYNIFWRDCPPYTFLCIFSMAILFDETIIHKRFPVLSLFDRQHNKSKAMHNTGPNLFYLCLFLLIICSSSQLHFRKFLRFTPFFRITKPARKPFLHLKYMLHWTILIYNDKF